MAYGLDIDEVYYTDSQLADMGVINTYEISLDCADEKNFSITSPEFTIRSGGYWYVPDTEYGGRVDGFETDSDAGEVTYKGRSWRGILHSHIVDVPDDQEARLEQGAVAEIINELLTEAGVSGLFVCDAPEVAAEVSTDVLPVEIARGTTLYDAITGVSASIDLNILYAFKSDRRVHLTPILAQDYSEYMQYSDVASLGFKVEVDEAVINHLIITATDEDGTRRTLHMFADQYGEVQPYATTDEPLQDSDYITDKSNQVLFGLDEVAEIELTDGEVVENYKLVKKPPADWATSFGRYYLHSFEDSDDGETEESWELCEAVGVTTYTEQQKQPKGWANNYSKYYTRSWNAETGKYEYSAVSADSELDLSTVKRIKKKKPPSDWRANYSEYYYRFQTGSGIEYREYAGVEKSKYVLLKKKPDDWAQNFSSYYRKVYKKVTYKKSGRKKKKVTLLVDCVDHKDAYYVACTEHDDSKNGKMPSFSKRRHYRKDTWQVNPKYNRSNCYRIRSHAVAPTWEHDKYYTATTVYNPPPFVEGEIYEKVYDHFAPMVEDGLAFFEDQKKSSSQTMLLDDFEVNIGDTVGGRDEFTGTVILRTVSNINVKITNGLIEAEYEVKGE